MNPHGCYNRADFAPSLRMQDGWLDEQRRKMVLVPFRMTPDCQYTHTELGQADRRCSDCKHQYKGEQK